MDLLDVVRMTDQHVLVDELRPEVAPLLRAAAHRQRSLVLLLHPGASPGSPKLRLHAVETGWDRVKPGRNCCSPLLDPDCVEQLARDAANC